MNCPKNQLSVCHISLSTAFPSKQLETPLNPATQVTAFAIPIESKNMVENTAIIMKHLFVLFAISVIAACGGGDSLDPPTAPVGPVSSLPAGVFDAPPSGVTALVFPPSSGVEATDSFDNALRAYTWGNAIPMKIEVANGYATFDIGEPAEWSFDYFPLKSRGVKLNDLNGFHHEVTARTEDGRISVISFDWKGTEASNRVFKPSQGNYLQIGRPNLETGEYPVSGSISVDGGAPVILTEHNAFSSYPSYFAVKNEYKFNFPDLKPGIHTAVGVTTTNFGRVLTTEPFVFETVYEPVLSLKSCTTKDNVFAVHAHIRSDRPDPTYLTMSVGSHEFHRELRTSGGTLYVATWSTDFPGGDYYLTTKILNRDGSTATQAVCRVTLTKS